MASSISGDDVEALFGFGLDGCIYLGDLLLGQLKRAVERRDLDLDSLDPGMAGLTGPAAASEAAYAAEVLVEAAFVAMDVVEHAATTVVAGQGALEITLMLTRLISGCSLCVKPGLYSVEQCLIDELRVTAFGRLTAEVLRKVGPC